MNDAAKTPSIDPSSILVTARRLAHSDDRGIGYVERQVPDHTVIVTYALATRTYTVGTRAQRLAEGAPRQVLPALTKLVVQAQATA